MFHIFCDDIFASLGFLGIFSPCSTRLILLYRVVLLVPTLCDFTKGYFPMQLSHKAVLASLGLACAAPSAYAQTQIDSATTINQAISGNVSIGLSTSSTFTVSVVHGGNIGGYLYGSGNSIVDLSGGSVGSYLQADANSVFNIYGSNLTLSNPTPYFTGTQYSLNGILQDGNPINLSAYSYDNGQFLLHNTNPVPEASSVVSLGLLLLLGVGGLAVSRRRKMDAVR